MGEYRLSTVPSLAAIGREAWDDIANTGWRIGAKGALQTESETQVKPFNPFVTYDFLQALEESGSATAKTGWTPSYLVVHDEAGQVVGAVPAYLKTHSRGEYVFDHGWADAYERAGGRYYPKLQISVPFTPVTGPRLLTRPAHANTIKPLLATGIQSLVRQFGLSSAHVTFVEQAEANRLEEAGFLLRLDQQFHFENPGYDRYEDFLGSLASRKRKALKRERRAALEANIIIEWLTGEALTESHFEAFFAFYMNTGNRKWGQPYLNRHFFSLILERMPERLLLVMAKRDGRYIAGALNFIGSETLYGRYWGAIEDHPFLHFEVCYHQAIDFAIFHRLKWVEAGAQGAHKLARGYLPRLTYSAHEIVDPRFRSAVADYLEMERGATITEKEFLTHAGPFRQGEAVTED